MMSISFIVTTYNIRRYVTRCLESVAQVARPGDQVILIDDGSDDGTLERVREFESGGHFASGVEFRPIYLGTNTMGGVGIGANIGLDEAGCDTVFFVDGDDWIDPAGFARARAHWAFHPTDILFTNYLEYDEKADRARHPADAQRWSAIDNALPLDQLRAHGLGLIAVPWRKFYRRAFLAEHGLRFPEGDYFFEDNPFHWAVCRRAASIGFVNTVSCHHRINRPGQTMASTGAELAAFFTHFGTILNDLDPDDRANRIAATRWLLNNMTWHMPRLAPSARHPYATAGWRALRMVPDDIWQELGVSEGAKSIWPVADRLRRGDVDGQLLQWQNASLEAMLADLGRRLARLEGQSAEGARLSRGLAAASAFESILALRRS